MNSFAASYHMPTNLHSFTPAMGGAPAKAMNTRANASSSTSSTSGSSSSINTAAGVGSTFLSLLAQELQNQDPTNPVDSTAMVGQMISLSQLGQLISINQTLSSAATTSTTPTTSHASPSALNSAAIAAANSGIANTLSPSAAGAATSQLPFDPNTMMPLNFANPGATSASVNPILNTSNMGLFGTNSNPSGGK